MTIFLFKKNKAPSLTRQAFYFSLLLLSPPMTGFGQPSEYHGPPALSSLVFAMEGQDEFEQCRAFHIKPGVAITTAYCARKYNFTGIVFDNEYTIWPKLLHNDYWALSAIEMAQSYPVTSVQENNSIGIALVFYDFPKNKVLTKHPTIPLLPPHITTPFNSDAKVYITSLNIGKIFNILHPLDNPYNNMFYAVPGVMFHSNSSLNVFKDTLGDDPRYNRFTVGDLEDDLGSNSDGFQPRKIKFFYPDNPGFKMNRQVNRLYGCGVDTGAPVYWKNPNSGQWYIIGMLGGHHASFEFLLNDRITDEALRERTRCFLLGVIHPFDHFAHYWITSTIDTHMGMSKF